MSLPLLLGGAAALLMLGKKPGVRKPVFSCPVCHQGDNSFRSEATCEGCEAHHEHMKVYAYQALQMKEESEGLHERFHRIQERSHEDVIRIDGLIKDARSQRNQGIAWGFTMGAIWTAGFIQVMGVVAQ